MRYDRITGSYFVPATLVELVRQRAQYHGPKVNFTYLIDGETQEQHLSNAELDRQARAIGAWLQSKGMEGQRALLLYPAGLDFIAAFFGCLYAGVIAVTAYPPRKNRSMERIQAIADDASARVALTTSAVLERVRPWMEQTPNLEALDWLCTDGVPAGREEDWREPKIGPQTLAFLQYTSGSTGTPKGVMLTHANLLHNSAMIAHAFEHTRASSGVYWLPTYHDMGLVGGILQPLYLNCRNVFMSPMSFLQKPVRWLQAISHYRGTTSGGPNFAYDLCVDKISDEERKTLDLSSWQVAFNGAEPIRPQTLQRFIELYEPCGFRPEAFYPCYGLAESTLIVSGGWKCERPRITAFDARVLEQEQRAQVATEPSVARTLLVANGECLSDQKLEIVDPDCHARCAPGEVGEIWVSGPSVAHGYWNREEESIATFNAKLADTGERPFLRTGDLGFLHENQLYVTGRIKDLIIIRGVNHYPQDIELTAETSHPSLRTNAAAAFTVPGTHDERLIILQEMERTRRKETAPAIEAIRRQVSQEHQLPISAIVLLKPGAIPKTSSGKVQRRAARELYLAGELPVIALWSLDAEAAAHAAEAKGEARVASSSRHHFPGGAHEPVGEVDAAVKRNARHVRSSTHAVHGTHGQAMNGNAPRRAAPPAGITRPHAGNPQQTLEVIFSLVRRLSEAPLPDLSGQTTLAELGFDSLQRIELQAAVEEHFGGRMPDEVGPQIDTLAEIAEAAALYLGDTGPESHARGREIAESDYRIEQFPECVQLQENLDLLASVGLGNPYFSAHEGLTRDTSLIGGREYISFSSYNYVSMSGDAAVTRAAQDAIAKYGTSVSASRLVSGEKDLHRELEQELASFLGTEDAIALVGGHATNVTTIGHLLRRGDLVLHDALAHNSIVQGALLSGASRRPVSHNDWRSLDKMLADLRHRYGRALVAIEGVYSMDGDLPDLPRYVEVAKRHKALLMVDEAHSLGVLGESGRGIAEHFGVDPADVPIWMGTLSKALGSCGGYIAGSHALVEYLKYTAPGFVFSVGMTPANAAASLEALRVLKREPQRVATLRDRSRLFLERARHRGLNTGFAAGTAVVPVITGNSMDCLRLSQALLQRGINVQPILYPAVDESAARLRFFITSSHTEDQICYTVDAVAEELERIDPRYLRRDRNARAEGQAISMA